jgi:hypothetical protein
VPGENSLPHPDPFRGIEDPPRLNVVATVQHQA